VTNSSVAGQPTLRHKPEPLPVLTLPVVLLLQPLPSLPYPVEVVFITLLPVPLALSPKTPPSTIVQPLIARPALKPSTSFTPMELLVFQCFIAAAIRKGPTDREPAAGQTPLTSNALLRREPVLWRLSWTWWNTRVPATPPLSQARVPSSWAVRRRGRVLLQDMGTCGMSGKTPDTATKLVPTQAKQPGTCAIACLLAPLPPVRLPIPFLIPILEVIRFGRRRWWWFTRFRLPMFVVPWLWTTDYFIGTLWTAKARQF
jgi:hypothetical protein